MNKLVLSLVLAAVVIFCITAIVLVVTTLFNSTLGPVALFNWLLLAAMIYWGLLQ